MCPLNELIAWRPSFLSLIVTGTHGVVTRSMYAIFHFSMIGDGTGTVARPHMQLFKMHIDVMRNGSLVAFELVAHGTPGHSCRVG
jgi:hypothetical protein